MSKGLQEIERSMARDGGGIDFKLVLWYVAAIAFVGFLLKSLSDGGHGGGWGRRRRSGLHPEKMDRAMEQVFRQGGNPQYQI